MAVAGIKPHQGKQHRCVLVALGYTRVRVHRRRAGEKTLRVEALQRCRQKTDRAHHRSAAADPIEHRKSRQPAVGLSVLIQLAACTGDGDRMLSKIQSRLIKARFRFEHAVARFLGSAGFRNHDDERVIESRPDLAQNAVETVRVGVIEEEDVHLIA